MASAPQFAGKFSGGNGARWLRQIKHDLKERGKTTVEDQLEYIDLLLEGKAAKWADSNTKVRSILDNVGTASAADLLAVQEAIKDKYPADVDDEPEISAQSLLKSLKQDKDESMASYHQRATAILSKLDCKDQSRAGDRNMTSGEKFILEGVITAFVDGLLDSALRMESINARVTNCGSLWRALEIVVDSQKFLQLKEKIRREDVEKKKAEAWDAFSTMKPGQVNSYLVSAGLPIPASLAALQNQSRSQSTTTVPTANQQTVPNQQAIQTYVPPHRQNNNTMAAPPQVQNQPFPERTQSLHPIINGSAVYNRNMGHMCFKCGDADGHYEENCTGRPMACWEMAYLKKIVLNLELPVERLYNQFVHRYAQPANTQRTITTPPAQGPPNIPRADGMHVTTSTPNQATQESQPPQQPQRRTMTMDQVQARFHDIPRVDGRNVDLVVVAPQKDKKAKVEAHQVGTRKHPRPSADEEDDVLAADDMERGPSAPKQKSKPKAMKKKATSEPEKDTGPDRMEMEEDNDEEEFIVKKKKRVPKELKEIAGRAGKGPIDYKSLLEKNTMTLSLMDLCQMSPDLAKHVRHLTTRVNKKKKKGTSVPAALAAAEVDANDAEVTDTSKLYDPNTIQATDAIPYLHFIHVNPEDKAFRVPARVLMRDGNEEVEACLQPAHVCADQGSDINIMSPGMAKFLKLKKHSIHQNQQAGLTMNTADGQSSGLTHFTAFDMGVSGIWRTVHAFVRPDAKSTDKHLLLGLPWLNDVKAEISIATSTITIGDEKLGEKKVMIEGPQFELSAPHKLMLMPKAPKYKAKIEQSRRIMELSQRTVDGEEDVGDEDDGAVDSSDYDSDSDGEQNDNYDDSDADSNYVSDDDEEEVIEDVPVDSEN